MAPAAALHAIPVMLPSVTVQLAGTRPCCWPAVQFVAAEGMVHCSQPSALYGSNTNAVRVRGVAPSVTPTFDPKFRTNGIGVQIELP